MGYSRQIDYPGRGIDLCRICGEPTRDHQIAPCPQLGELRLVTTNVRGGSVEQQSGLCRNCGNDARRRTDGAKTYTLYCSDACRVAYHRARR